MTNKNSDRHSDAEDDPATAGTPQQVAAAEAENALQQFDYLRKLIAKATESSSSSGFRLRVSHLTDLNRLAIRGLHARAGAFRTVPITIHGSGHTPPPHEEVPRHLEDMCDYVNDSAGKSAVHLAAYVMWRLNWIHPFYDGNGRTTRAASYLILCAKLGYPLPGTTSIPELISKKKGPYYKALEKADEACRQNEIDLTEMETILDNALADQLASIIEDAQSPTKTNPPSQPTGIRSTVAHSYRESVIGRKTFTMTRSVKVGLFLTMFIAAIAGAWSLLLNWEHPQVQAVRDFITNTDSPQKPESNALPPNTEPGR